MRKTPKDIKDIDMDFQQKERQEFAAIPDTKIRRRGERELYTPNQVDDYAIINTRNGWKTLSPIKQETSIPSNSVGQDGENRTLNMSNRHSLLIKVNSVWYELNFEQIASATGLDSLALSTVGHTAYTAASSGTFATTGYHSF